MIRALNRPDALAGLLFVVLGAAFLAISTDYDLGSAKEMGAGYFPRVLSVILIGLGSVQVVRAASLAAAKDEDRPTFHLRPAVFVLGGMAIFAAALQSLGLVLASVLLVLMAGVVAPGRRWIEVVSLAVVLATFCALVFVKALGVVMPLWPGAF